MKTFNTFNISLKSVSVVWFLPIGLSILVLTGCTSTGYKKGDAAAIASQTAAAEVQAEARTLELSMAALNDLLNKPNPDLKPQFQRFSQSVDELIRATQWTDRTARGMQQRNTAYLKTWNKELGQMNYQAIRDRSAARKAEVSSQLETINRQYREARAAVQPLIAYLEDIRRALSADLTNRGLEAVRASAGNANGNSEKLQAALGSLAAQLTASSASMSSFAWQKSGSEEKPAAAALRSQKGEAN